MISKKNLKIDLINDNLELFISNFIEKRNKDLLIKDNNVIYQLTSFFNQINNKYDNIFLVK